MSCASRVPAKKDGKWVLKISEKAVDRYLKEFRALDERVEKSLVVSEESLNRKITI